MIVVGSREVVRTDPSRTIPPLGGRLSITSLPSPPALAQGGPSRPGRKTRYSCPLWGLVGVRTASTIWSGWIPSNGPAPRVGSGEACRAREARAVSVLNDLIKKKRKGGRGLPPIFIFPFFHLPAVRRVIPGEFACSPTRKSRISSFFGRGALRPAGARSARFLFFCAFAFHKQSDSVS